MQSFLLIAVCYILIINVTFCRNCNESFCRGKCYYKHKGFDYGVCNKDNNCVCAPMDIYIFDGVDRAVNGEYTQYSLNRSNVQRMSSLWENIVNRITTEYAFITKEDLANLKIKMFKELSAFNLFFTMYGRYSLETVLNQLKDQYPNMAMECSYLLMFLEKNKAYETVEYIYEDVSEENKTSELKNESLESLTNKVIPSTETPTKKITPSIKTTPEKVAPPVQITPPGQVTPTSNSKSNDATKFTLTTSQSRSLGSFPTKPESKTNTNYMNPNMRPNNILKLAKPNNKRTVVEQIIEKKQKIEYVTSEEDTTVEDSSEESLEEKAPEKTQTQKNDNKVVQNRQPIKK